MRIARRSTPTSASPLQPTAPIQPANPSSRSTPGMTTSASVYITRALVSSPSATTTLSPPASASSTSAMTPQTLADKRYDLAVIGAGPAGVAAAAAAGKFARVILIDAAPRLGGSVTAAMHRSMCGLYAQAPSS